MDAKRKYLLNIIKHFKFKPTIDLFASHLNRQIDRFESWKTNPECLLVDTFDKNSKMSLICFLSMLNKFMKKIE